MKTLVLGLGNPLRGDDGLGPAVIKWLQERGLSPGMVAIDGHTAGLDLVSTLAGYRRAIIVDAADMGRAPGEWARFTPAQVRWESSGPTGVAVSLHAAGLADALALGAALGVLPEEVVIFGVQPARLDWTPGLSAEAQAAMPEVGRCVLKEIGS